MENAQRRFEFSRLGGGTAGQRAAGERQPPERSSATDPQTARGFAAAMCGTPLGVPNLCIAQDGAADELLGRDPLAVVVGMLLDQHMRERSSDEFLLPGAHDDLVQRHH